MAGLDGQDGAGGGEVRLAHDVGGGAEVGRDADALEDGGGGEEGVDVLVAEVVLAGLDGGGTGSCETSNVSILFITFQRVPRGKAQKGEQ